MSIAERLPASTRGRTLALAGAAGAWILAYWINGWVWDRLLYDVAGLRADARPTETIHFFCYDTVKIALLLVGIIFVVTVLRSYMSLERTRALLGGKRQGVGNVMAGRPGRDHPVLLVQRRTGVHRVRRRRLSRSASR